MSNSNESALEVLKSINESLKQHNEALAETMKSSISVLRAILDALTRASVGAQTASAGKGGAVADDADLDSKWGNPEVRFDPRDWTGEPMVGKTYSQCPPEFLDLLAKALDYFADKDEAAGKTTSTGKPTAPYTRKDAARARGWAARTRTEQVPF